MAFLEERLPDNISRGVTGGITFSTIVTVASSGAEQRVGLWKNGRRKWQISQEQRTREEAETLIAFWTATRGKLNGFRFRDWSDYEAENQPLQNISTYVWQLQKVYIVGTFTHTRKITKPVTGSVTISGYTPSQYTVDYTSGLVTFNTVASSPTASFQFDVPVRFDTDEMGMEQTDIDEFHWNSIPIIETI